MNDERENSFFIHVLEISFFPNNRINSLKKKKKKTKKK